MSGKGLRNSSITVGDFYEGNCQRMNLKLLSANTGFEREIVEAEIHRPGLALAGFLELFTYKRVQVLGNTEMRYLNALHSTQLSKAIENVLKFDLPCIVVTDSNEPPEILLKIANKRKICVFSSDLGTTRITSLLSDYLQTVFAPRTSIHGTLVDVYGIGVLFTGRSGIGKSEVALDLVERGHRLVADDLIVITKKSGDILIGEGQDISEHLLEIRGLGLIDIKRMYGIWAVRVHKRIEVVVDLVAFDPKVDYDRTGLDGQNRDILEVGIPCITLPINPGKNITVIVETIAMNQMLKIQGHNTAHEFNERLIDRMRLKEKAHLTQLKKTDYIDKDTE